MINKNVLLARRSELSVATFVAIAILSAVAHRSRMRAFVGRYDGPRRRTHWKVARDWRYSAYFTDTHDISTSSNLTRRDSSNGLRMTKGRGRPYENRFYNHTIQNLRILTRYSSLLPFRSLFRFWCLAICCLLVTWFRFRRWRRLHVGLHVVCNCLCCTQDYQERNKDA